MGRLTEELSWKRMVMEKVVSAGGGGRTNKSVGR